MIRMLVLAVAAFLSVGAAADRVQFSVPDSADDVLEARDVPIRLHFEADQWSLTPQSSNFPLLARAVHKENPISGAFVYRDQPASDEAVRQRARAELEEAFVSHEIDQFAERIVNGVSVLYMKARATNTRGTEVEIRNYYWTGPQAVADYSLVARRAHFEANRQAIMDLLNGLEIAEAESAN